MLRVVQSIVIQKRGAVHGIICDREIAMRANHGSCSGVRFESNQVRVQVIAIVDDDALVRSALQALMNAVDLAVLTFASAEEFLLSGKQHQTRCLIADVRMPGMSGLELLAKLNVEKHPIPTIFITAHGDARLRMQALRAGAVEFLAKPFDDDVLLDKVREVLAG